MLNIAIRGKYSQRSEAGAGGLPGMSVADRMLCAVIVMQTLVDE